ncbi:MAG: DUF3106 domain-containing protein [Planctomycetota bacterium]
MKRAYTWVVLPMLAAVLAVALGAPALAADDEALAERRARWQAMTSEQRAELRQRFEELRELSPERRAELRERARDLRQREDRMRHRAEFRREFERRSGRTLEGAEPEHVRAAMRDFRRRCDRERGEGLRRRLPDELRRTLEAAPPGERPRLLHEFVSERRAKHHERFLRVLARRLQLPPDELESVRALEGAARHVAVRELHRRVIEREVEETGLGDVTPEEWRQVQALDTERFLERVRWLDLPRRSWRGDREGGRGGGSKRRRAGGPPDVPARPAPAKPAPAKPPPVRRSPRPHGPG